MRNGSFSRYYNVSSIIHSLNPLCKILALMLFIFMAIIASNIREMCCLFIILIFIIGFSNISIFCISKILLQSNPYLTKYGKLTNKNTMTNLKLKY